MTKNCAWARDACRALLFKWLPRPCRQTVISRIKGPRQATVRHPLLRATNGDLVPDLACECRRRHRPVCSAMATDLPAGEVGVYPWRALQSVAIADVNRNGRPDLAVANTGSNAVACCSAMATGRFRRR